MDRPHHIGQMKQVYVFQFIAENSIEKRMLECRRDQLMIQRGRQHMTAHTEFLLGLWLAANKEAPMEMVTVD